LVVSNLNLDSGMTFHAETLYVAPNAWLKGSGPKAAMALFGFTHGPKAWMRLDMAKLAPSFVASLSSVDQTNVTEFMAGLSSATATGHGTYRGTIDGTKINVLSEFEASQAKALGRAAKSLAYTAAVDDHGRMIRFAVSIPAIRKDPAFTYSATFSDYEKPVAISAPSQAVPAPASIYNVLGGK
jgi:hypothetical protein